MSGHCKDRIPCRKHISLWSVLSIENPRIVRAASRVSAGLGTACSDCQSCYRAVLVYAAGLISVVAARPLPITPKANGIVVRPPTDAKASPAALRWSLLSLLESKRPIPAPSATRVPPISKISAIVSFRSIILAPHFAPGAATPGTSSPFDALRNVAACPIQCGVVTRRDPNLSRRPRQRRTAFAAHAGG